MTRNLNKKFYEVCRKIYNKPASITIIKGAWKTGKTDFSLFLAQYLKHYKIIEEIGANIEIYPSKTITKPEFINNFIKLRMWGFGSERRKLYIFDEALKNAPSREAMTKLNKQWVKIIPEISKMRLHVVVITQQGEKTYMESIFMDPQFSHGTWEKVDLAPRNKFYRKKVTLSSKKYFNETMEFSPIPKTTLKFDAYQGAIMTLEPEDDSLIGVPLPVKIAFDYFNGASTDEIKSKYELPTRTEATRQIKKGGLMLHKVCHVSPNLRWDNGGAQMTQYVDSDDSLPKVKEVGKEYNEA